MKLSIVLSTHPAQFEAVAFKGDFQKHISEIAGLGYDGVELAIRDPNLVNSTELGQMIASHDLVVPGIGTGQAWGEEGLSFTSDDPSIRAAAIDRTLAHISLAAQFNAIIIVGLLRGVTPSGHSKEESMAYLVDALKVCCSSAAEKEVRLALEPLNRYETDLINNVSEGLSLIQHVGVENLGLLLDTFHMNIEEPSITDSIRACGNRIFHFHVADSNRWYPGAGHLDFIPILEALYQAGYGGYISGEFMPQPDANTAAKLGIAHLRNLQEERLAFHD
ncbi:MAG: hypothetical protein A2Z14_18485 [Chloroflexi bacterium RBG_16_48_8]|nr:MAG: hypothetical protein A2Z14_18485 [Chloroflexi bacterium RBG_16_48_8]